MSCGKYTTHINGEYPIFLERCLVFFGRDQRVVLTIVFCGGSIQESIYGAQSLRYAIVIFGRFSPQNDIVTEDICR